MRRKEPAASEIFGALVLTGVIVGLFAIIAVVLLSQPPPELLPSVEFNLTIDDKNVTSSHNVTIMHKRGDSFRVFDEAGSDQNSSFYVTIDGNKWPVTKWTSSSSNDTFRLINTSIPDDPHAAYFSAGDELVGPYSGQKPQKVQFIYKAPGGAEYLLWGTGDEGKAGITFTFREISCTEVQFIADTSNFLTATSFIWDFGDGTTSTERNPLHAYGNCGPKTVTLTMSDGSTTLITTQVITIRPPRASFRTDKTAVSIGESVQFTDDSYCKQSTQRWEFGDGSSSTEQNPSHSYNASGTYFVNLTEGISPCDNTVTQPITVTDYCVNITGLYFNEPIFISNDALFTEQFTAQYTTGSSPVFFSWDFGDGHKGTGVSPKNTYTTPGIYTVNLTATNPCSSSTMSRQITVLHTPESCPNVHVSIDPINGGYAPLNLALNGTALTGVGASISKTLWDFGDNSTSNDLLTQHVYNDAGTFLINLSATNDCGKSDSTTRLVTILSAPVIADFIPTPPVGDAPLGVIFTDNSTSPVPIIFWSWDFGDGSPIFNGTDPAVYQNPGHTYSSPGTYQVTLTAGNGYQTDSETKPITVTPPIIADFIPIPPNGTAPLSVTFTDNSTSSVPITFWSWDFGDGSPIFEGNNSADYENPNHTYVLPGTYQVSLTVGNGYHNDSITKPVTVTPPPIIADFTPTPPTGAAELAVHFVDNSTSAIPITSWRWDFGDGSPIFEGNVSSVYQNPNHTYLLPGNYPVTLTVSNGYLYSSVTKVVTVLCPPPHPSFIFEITDFLDFTVKFTDTSDFGDFDSNTTWLWDFGDMSSSNLQNPVHVYGGSPRSFNVSLTIGNSCGSSNTTTRLVNPNCAPITAGMNASPLIGMPPLLVSFYDTSTPVANITSWRWLFGDGKSYYTTDPSARNTTHVYDKIGTYYATLMVENICGQAFIQTKVVTISSPATISGHLWSDKNQNAIQDSGEVNLSGWRVDLEERVGNDWVQRLTQNTDASGNYLFLFNTVNGVYRVKEFLKTNVLWKATYAYNSDGETVAGYVVSGSIPIQATRNFSDINFGDVDWHTSSFQFPDRFKYGEIDGGTTWSDRTTNNNEYWDYTTSYDNNTQRLWNPANKQTNPSPSYVYYQVPPYSRWGDSSFTITPGFYMQYLIFVQSNGQPPISKTYWLKYWIYNGVRTNGVTLSVPDNSIYTANNVMLYFIRNDTPWSSIYVPEEGSLIPYSTSSYIEVHFTGTAAADMRGYLIKPVNSGPPAIPLSLTWQPAYGYFTANWNNTPFENQSVLLEVQVDRGSAYPSINRYYNTQRNVWVDWEPITPVITTPANNAIVSGNVVINATVTGKNRDTNNVNLVVGGKDIYQMTFDSGANRFTKTLDMEPYSGKNTTLVVRASPQANKGKTIDSASVNVTVLSKKLLAANFTADPWTGNSTLEVAFTDTSTGGPNWWNWTFGDGNKSSLQNPFNYFANPGNYSVILQVKNATGSSSSVSKWVNVTGRMHEVTFLSSRKGALISGGSQRWITMTGGASVTVNGTVYPILPGDVVQMDILSQQNISRILIAGTYTIFNATNTSLTINEAYLNTGNVTQIHIPDFVNYHSNLHLTADSNKTAYATLIWDGVPVNVDWRQRVDIFDLMPSTGPSMDLDISPGQVFFSGKSSRYVLT